MTTRKQLAVVSMVSLLACVGATGCGQRIYLSSSEYVPGIHAGDFSPFRGKSVLMPSFSNRAENTSIFYWYGAEGRRYGGPVLTSFFWYVFKEDFNHIGVNVFDKGAPAGSPQLDVELVSLTESSFDLAVRLTPVQGQALRKNFHIAGPPVTGDDDYALKWRAYHMVDLAFASIIDDAEFRAAFVGVPPPAPQPAPTTSAASPPSW
jgi:hypothetical protein